MAAARLAFRASVDRALSVDSGIGLAGLAQSGLWRSPARICHFGLQLLLNAAWTPIFFGLHRPGLALLEIVVLWASIVATIALFAPISQIAAWLLTPYLVWVSFASLLNFSIWRRNRASGF